MEAEARNLWIAYMADRTSQCDRILCYFKGVVFSCCFHDRSWNMRGGGRKKVRN